MFQYKAKEIEDSVLDNLEYEINELAKDGWRVCKILKKYRNIFAL